MPFSWIYARVADLRNTLYERGTLQAESLGAPAISIGNITVGGTGKTPLVAFVTQVLAERGEKVGILTRGYGRENSNERVVVSDSENILADSKTAGDEPAELAIKLPGKAVIIADANRVAAARWAVEKFKITAFVLDDAFQHRRAKRDLDIVLLDATNPFGNLKVLPFGILREPLKNLRRADVIIITRANLVSNDQISDLKLQITNYNPTCPIFTAENKTSKLIALKNFLDKSNPKAEIPNPESIAFCALGNPDNFFEQLRRADFKLAATRRFPDHHRYTQSDIVKIEQEAKQKNAEILLTTAKDAVKLADLEFDLPCYVVESELVFDDEKKLRQIISAVL